MREKKVRGMKRKTNQMIRRIEARTLTFPEECHHGYWHLPLPVAQDFIGSHNTPQKIKRLCIQTLLDRAKHLIELKPKDGDRYRVVVAVDLPGLWWSQIIVFKGDSYFKNFFNRNNEYQKWIPLSDHRNLQTEWSLSIPQGWETTGFKQIIMEEDGFQEENEWWFIGELKE
ncbi:DUF3916 domain-containing protein [Bacillus sp. 179-C3.3 HS]|uniref:DUF3916 domain-containing protein n=1 Tax=Bacillus sp. 179-C3.3 HS TaxID=3232162 RepID=UPI00399FA047